MKLRDQVLAILSFATVAVCWKNTAAFEFASPECKGLISKAWIGMNYEQIAMKNSTQSIYIATANDGIWRWYGYPSATEDGTACYGEPIGRLHWPCFDLNGFVAKEGKPRVECIRLCSMWAGKEHSYSCAAIGITE
ncbi:hypothetical protein F5Y08DRAFT_246976 [Xylaria arbuscula]|nr:hypothetical protein F5Y08DRAFT_246976 [Xylaria arbuscula]